MSRQNIDILHRTFSLEIAALQATLGSIDEISFQKAISLIYNSKGNVVVTGVGKSGLVGRKIASTLSSVGTPSLFLHPVEAAHGDLGIVKSDDVILMLSKSGQTDELSSLVPSLLSKNIPIIIITAARESVLAKAAERSGGVVLHMSIPEEACPHDLAPTSSTTAQMVIGDALAVALLDARNFTSEDFAKLHPAGALGRRLTLTVNDIMAVGDDIPRLTIGSNFLDALREISRKRLGVVCIIDDGKLAGIITDGDVRRYLEHHTNGSLADVSVEAVMTTQPKVTAAGTMALDALRLMQEKPPRVMHLPVIDEKKHLVGIVHLHDLASAGIVEV